MNSIIYLQVGASEVTWCEQRINPTDLCYRLVESDFEIETEAELDEIENKD